MLPGIDRKGHGEHHGKPQGKHHDHHPGEQLPPFLEIEGIYKKELGFESLDESPHLYVRHLTENLVPNQIRLHLPPSSGTSSLTHPSSKDFSPALKPPFFRRLSQN
jgi:hypothetical protein